MLVEILGAEIRLEVEPGDFLFRVGAKNDGGTKTRKSQLKSWLARMLSLEYDVFCTHIVFLSKSNRKEEEEKSRMANQHPHPPQPPRARQPGKRTRNMTHLDDLDKPRKIQLRIQS
jgi:hypothetical protein